MVTVRVERIMAGQLGLGHLGMECRIFRCAVDFDLEAEPWLLIERVCYLDGHVELVRGQCSTALLTPDTWLDLRRPAVHLVPTLF